MSRFTKVFRSEFPNKIAAHFDKYVEYVNPLTFCPLNDVYRRAFTPEEWDAFNVLMKRKIGRECFQRSLEFELYLPGNKSRSSYERTHVTFQFPDGKRRPNLDIEFDKLTDKAQAKINKWLKTAVQYRKLRQFLYRRVQALLDWGWTEDSFRDSYTNRWRIKGKPTPGQGCNTVGQVNRIWPELLVFFPPDEIATVRNASMLSRMPAFFKLDRHTLTPEQFMLVDPLFHDRDQTEKYTHEEMVFERRKLAAVNHILIQMSLMKDVPHVNNYPTITLASS